jgi:RNA polymerase sigma-70 factor (ECF subfamily)
MIVSELQAQVTAAKAGDQESFRALFLLLEPQLYAFVYSRVKDAALTEDIVQEALIALFRGLPQFTFESSPQFYQYIYTIVRRLLAKQYMIHAKKDVVLVEDEEAFRESRVIPATAIEHDVAAALASLDEVSRDIMVLHHWSRHTFGEIGQILNLAEGAVRTRHHRAKEQLASLLK